MLVDETDKKRKYIDNVEFRQVVMIAFIEYRVWATSCSTHFVSVLTQLLFTKKTYQMIAPVLQIRKLSTE